MKHIKQIKLTRYGQRSAAAADSDLAGAARCRGPGHGLPAVSNLNLKGRHGDTSRRGRPLMIPLLLAKINQVILA